jgi:hypothetical protein
MKGFMPILDYNDSDYGQRALANDLYLPEDIVLK